jgi:hypothetical protein
MSGTQFSTLNSAGINDTEGPEKYNKGDPYLIYINIKVAHIDIHKYKGGPY